MPKISNRKIYTPDILVTGREFWTLTNEDGKTVTLALSDVEAFLSGGDGIQNLDGTYTWIKYAQNITGEGMVNEPTVDTPYIGLAYNKTSNVESIKPEDYIWGLVDGVNLWVDEAGTIHYTWIKFADTPTSGMTDSPFGKAYIGLAFDKTTSTESVDYGLYHWTTVKGVRYPYNQNNRVRVIDINESELTSTDATGVANWVNQNGLTVLEDEVIAFNIILNDIPIEVIPVLDQSKALILSFENVTETTAKLFWETNDDSAIDRFTIVYTDIDSNITKTIDLSNSNISQILTGLLDGKNYSAYIIAYDANNNQKLSNTVSFKTIEIFVASTPNLLITNITDTTIALKWNVEASFGADGYELFQDGVRIQAGPELTYIQTSLTENTSYDFYVIAYNGSTASNASAVVTGTTLQTIDPPLTTPVLSLVSKGLTSINTTVVIPLAEWPRIDAATSKLYYRVLNATNWSVQNYDVAQNQGNIIGLTQGVTYEIRVQFSDGNVLSNFSNILTVTTNVTPPIGSDIYMGVLNPNTSNQGTLQIKRGQPYENIEVSAVCIYFPDGEYDVNLRTQVNGYSFISNDNSDTFPTEEERTVIIPIQLDGDGNSLNNLIAVYGTYDILTKANRVIAKYTISKRSSGNLPLTSSSNIFYIEDTPIIEI